MASVGEHSPEMVISVLIPCYNDGQWIRQCLRSVQRQTWQALETIIVDDGSNDEETLCVLASAAAFPGVTVLRQVNGGPSKARNAALAAAKGAYVLFLDADDYLEDTALEVLVRAALERGADFIAGGWRDVDDDGRQLRSAMPSSVDPYVRVVTDRAPMGTILLRRWARPLFRNSVPWEVDAYFLDYLSLGARAIFIDDIVVNIRQSGRPERLTNKLNHFEPLRMGCFFSERKIELARLGLATDERIAALDQRILNSLHALLYAKRYTDAAVLAKQVKRTLLRSDPHYRFGSFVWTFGWGGLPAARAFVFLNHLVWRS